MSYTPPPSNETDFNFSGALAYTPSVGSGVNFTFEVQVVVQCITFDGLDDGMSTGAITLGSDMDCFIAVRRNSAVQFVPIDGASGAYVVAVPGGPGSCAASIGAPTYAVNGVPISGGTAVSSGALHLAIAVGAWSILEIRNANMASGWSLVSIGGSGGYRLNGDIAGVILCPAGDATARQKNRQWLGNKVGLVLP